MRSFPISSEQMGSNRMPRRINRNLLFNFIRTRQPISRADLARISGLQRSTVSLIVEELISDRWIVEGPTNTRRALRGRQPIFLQLDTQRAVIALDIHPAQTTIGISDLAGSILARNTIPVPEEPAKALSAIVSGIRKVIADHTDRSFVGIGICVPGRTDLTSQKLVFAPNVKWPVIGLKSRIERATELRVMMDNVANACALSEVWFGAADGKHDLVVVNVSEGIGTGIFANGQLLRGDSGMAGEFGHVQLDPRGLPCSCGSCGCWETLASNGAALRYYQQRAPKGTAHTFAALLDLARIEDRDAIGALTEACVHLGRGIRMIASALAPREIVVVGDITAVWERFGPVVEREMQAPSTLKTPLLRPSPNGGEARLRSAVALVLNEGLL